MVGLSEIILKLAEAPAGPHAQIDEQICARLRELALAPTAEGMKKILDDCAFAGLASGFAMMAMDAVWKMLIKEQQEKPHD